MITEDKLLVIATLCMFKKIRPECMIYGKHYRAVCLSYPSRILAINNPDRAFNPITVYHIK